MKPRKITSEEGRDFLDAFGGSTRNVYRTGLGVFLVFYEGTLTDFLDQLEDDLQRSRRERKWIGRKVLRDFSRWLQKQGYTPKSVRTYVSSVQSLARYYGYHITTRYINLPTSQPVSHKHPWTVNEAYNFINQLPTVELQSIAVTTLQSGLGPADILGLTYNDIKREFEEEIVPLCLDFARKKTDVPFMSFIGKWGFSLLKQHLKGKKLQLETPLYTIGERMIRYHFRKLGQAKIGRYIGFNPCRLYSLRSAFRTILGDAGCPETYIEFWMGHIVSEVKRVYVSKSRDGWRAEYKKYESMLSPSTFNV